MRDEITRRSDGSPLATASAKAECEERMGRTVRFRARVPGIEHLSVERHYRQVRRCRRTKGHSTPNGLFHLCLFTLLLVAVVLCLVGAFHRNADVVGLLLRELRELDADLFKVQAGYFFVQLL